MPNKLLPSNPPDNSLKPNSSQKPSNLALRKHLRKRSNDPRKIKATNTRNGRSTLEVAPVSPTGLRRNSCVEGAALPQWVRRAITGSTLDCASTSSLIRCTYGVYQL